MHYLKTRPPRAQSECPVVLRWISLFSKFSQIKTTASALSDELGVNEIVKKKVNGNWDNINKNGHSTFHTAGESGNLNSL